MAIKVGEIYTSTSCGNMEVIEYVNASKVRIRFLDTGYERYTAAKEVRSGKIRDLLTPSVRYWLYWFRALYPWRR